MASLRALARQVAWSGVRRVEGRLMIDGSYFADDGVPPHFDDQPGEHGGYRAPVAAASLARNAVTVIVVANPTGRGRASLQLSPPGGDYVEVVEHQVATVARGDTRIWMSSRTRAGRVSLRVTGRIRHRDGVAFVRRRVDEPDRLLAAGLRGALAEVGVRVHGGLGRGPAPATAIIVAERRSPSLGAVVRAMNKTSDNFTAETVFKTLGAEHLRSVAVAAAESGIRSPAPPPATWLDAQHAVRRYLVEVVGLPAGGVRIENGSGLYDSTGVSAHAVAKVLRSAYRDVRVGPELMASLAIGGVDGTLRRRLRGPAVRGRVRGKTGTLAGVSSLAGYVGVETGRPLAFVVLVNRLDPHRRRAAHAFQDAIATLAAEFSALRE
jgi:D-alanyl-D-alanine carboxypeptidase/D-alanyl-D-alanine-endopeptidase (penicillin-binding protein 4)